MSQIDSQIGKILEQLQNPPVQTQELSFLEKLTPAVAQAVINSGNSKLEAAGLSKQPFDVQALFAQNGGSGGRQGSGTGGRFNEEQKIREFALKQSKAALEALLGVKESNSRVEANKARTGASKAQTNLTNIKAEGESFKNEQAVLQAPIKLAKEAALARTATGQAVSAEVQAKQDVETDQLADKWLASGDPALAKAGINLKARSNPDFQREGQNVEDSLLTARPELTFDVMLLREGKLAPDSPEIGRLKAQLTEHITGSEFTTDITADLIDKIMGMTRNSSGKFSSEQKEELKQFTISKLAPRYIDLLQQGTVLDGANRSIKTRELVRNEILNDVAEKIGVPVAKLEEEVLNASLALETQQNEKLGAKASSLRFLQGPPRNRAQIEQIKRENALKKSAADKKFHETLNRIRGGP